MAGLVLDAEVARIGAHRAETDDASAERPVVSAGEVRAAPTMDLTLVYDHRAVDGHPASLMLADLRDRLQRADLGLDG